MAPPWTAAQAAGDDVSKKMLITYMQENCDASFLADNKLNGQPNAIVKRVTKETLVEVYTKHIGSAGGSPAAAGAPPASGFNFSPPGGDSSPFTFTAAPAPPAGGSSFTFNFNAPASGDGDDVEDVDTSKMKTRGGGMGGGIPFELQERMRKLNMSATQRRDATIAELAPAVRSKVEGLEKLQESVDELSKEFEAKLQALKDQYEKKKAPLFKQRFEVIKDGGVPDFWLTALQNNMITAEEIQQADVPVLKSLIDIKCVPRGVLRAGLARGDAPSRAVVLAAAHAATPPLPSRRPAAAPPTVLCGAARLLRCVAAGTLPTWALGRRASSWRSSSRPTTTSRTRS